MKLQDIILYVPLMIITSWGIQYFFVTPMIKKQEGVTLKSGQSLIATPADQLTKPLLLDIAFAQERGMPEQKSTVTTPHATYTFSTHGGSLVHIENIRTINHKQEALSILDITDDHEKKAGGLFVALTEASPYEYQLIRNQRDDHQTTVIYEAQTTEATITKQFIIDDHTHVIDTTITIEPRGQKTVLPRIFLPGPLVPALGAQQNNMALAFTDKNVIEKIKPADVINKIWVQPTLFGAENRYFVNALITDNQKFTQRAYYKIINNEVTTILEGPAITEKKTWTMSFYCGPKDNSSMVAADPRLEETLEYGWFGPLSKMLLGLLNLLYSYVHNYGWAIVIMTILMNLLTYPLTVKSSSNINKHAEYARKKQYLEQKYKHDRELLAHEQAELATKYGPKAGDMLGCLPYLILIPVFMALNKVLNNSIDLYHAPFIGWITDLSVKDPYYVLPTIMGLGILLQGAQGTNHDPRQYVLKIFIALVVVGIMGNFSAGLTLFLCTKTICDFIQNKLQK
ncbi:MAG: membrane protein insertase YidC [Candidatus Babeliaceae bacterium]|jgi:YidC/Oxa1 family membrane protein insertase